MRSPLGNDNEASKVTEQAGTMDASAAADENAKHIPAGKTLEVGHCFQLPGTYCEVARTQFTDSLGVMRTPLMSSYGLGVSRLLGHLAFAHADAKGLAFPPQVAPFYVAILPQPSARWKKGRRATRLGEALFKRLQQAAADTGGSADVMLDDRQGLSLRQMQGHADLVGIPHQLIIKEELLQFPEKACVLYISRNTGKAEILSLKSALGRVEGALQLASAAGNTTPTHLM